MEFDHLFGYRNCMHCAHSAYDIGKRKYVCNLGGRDIGGNWEVWKPTECDKWKNIVEHNYETLHRN